VSLLGTCADCGVEGVQLRYKPDVPSDEQTRPSICDRCRDEREHMLEQDRRYRDLHGAEHLPPAWVAARDDADDDDSGEPVTDGGRDLPDEVRDAARVELLRALLEDVRDELARVRDEHDDEQQARVLTHSRRDVVDALDKLALYQRLVQTNDETPEAFDP